MKHKTQWGLRFITVGLVLSTWVAFQFSFLHILSLYGLLPPSRGMFGPIQMHTVTAIVGNVYFFAISGAWFFALFGIGLMLSDARSYDNYRHNLASFFLWVGMPLILGGGNFVLVITSMIFFDIENSGQVLLTSVLLIFALYTNVVIGIPLLRIGGRVVVIAMVMVLLIFGITAILMTLAMTSDEYYNGLIPIIPIEIGYIISNLILIGACYRCLSWVKEENKTHRIEQIT